MEEGKKLLTVTEKGYGKRSEFDDIACRGRGGKGVTCHNLTEKTGLLSGILSVTEEDDILMITNDGTVIRTAVSEIPTYNRTATGVIVMRLEEGAVIVNITRMSASPADSTETPADSASAAPADSPVDPTDPLDEASADAAADPAEAADGTI